MSRVRLQPHHTAATGAVTFGKWWARLNGERLEVADRLKGWDYEAALTFELQPSFDVDLLLRSTGLASAAELAVTLLLDCPSVGERWAESYLLSDYLESDASAMEIAAPKGCLAQDVRLSAHVVLWDRRPHGGDGVASRPGSRLAWSDVQNVVLEGDGARFPTEEVSFEALGMERAAWTLRVTYDDLSEPFMSTVRLLVNRDHPAAPDLLGGEASSELLQSALRMDVARQLFLVTAADSTRSGDEGPWEEGSVGHVLTGMANVFLKMELSTALNLARSDPLRFERKVQAAFEFLELR